MRTAIDVSPTRDLDERGVDAAADANAPRALLAQLAAAFRALTVLPFGGSGASFAESALFFPAVGLVLGCGYVAVDRAVGGSSRGIADELAVVAVMILATGGRHLAALARTAVALFAAGTGDRGAPSAAALPLRRVLAVAAVPVLAVLVMKVAALAVTPDSLRPTALVLAAVLARWSMVVLAFGSRPAHDAVPPPALVSMKFREFGVASVSALGLGLVAADARALLAIMALAVVTISMRILAHRWWGGVRDDVLGGIVEISEAIVLGVCTVGTSMRM